MVIFQYRLKTWGQFHVKPLNTNGVAVSNDTSLKDNWANFTIYGPKNRYYSLHSPVVCPD